MICLRKLFLFVHFFVVYLLTPLNAVWIFDFLHNNLEHYFWDQCAQIQFANCEHFAFWHFWRSSSAVINSMSSIFLSIDLVTQKRKLISLSFRWILINFECLMHKLQLFSLLIGILLFFIRIEQCFLSQIVFFLFPCSTLKLNLLI